MGQPVRKIVDDDMGIFVTRDCPHCPAHSGLDPGMRDLENFLNFYLVLAGLKEMLKGRNVEFSFQTF